jgi:hypothetical protein
MKNERMILVMCTRHGTVSVKAGDVFEYVCIN